MPLGQPRRKASESENAPEWPPQSVVDRDRPPKMCAPFRCAASWNNCESCLGSMPVVGPAGRAGWNASSHPLFVCSRGLRSGSTAYPRRLQAIATRSSGMLMRARFTSCITPASAVKSSSIFICAGADTDMPGSSLVVGSPWRTSCATARHRCVMLP